MKPTTHIYLKATNVGTPKDQLEIDGPAKEVARQLIEWWFTHSMNKRYDICVTRSPQTQPQTASDIDDIFAGVGIVFDESQKGEVDD